MLKLLRPSPALIVATIALFVAAGGGAWAATKDPGSAVYAKATSPKAHVASRGPRGPRGFRGPAGPSDGYVVNASVQQQLPSGTDTKLAQLTLKVRGSYIITAATSLAGNAGTDPNFANCSVLQNSNPVAEGTTLLAPGIAAFTAEMTLTAAVNTGNGSNVSLSCNTDGLGFARHVAITAVRVGTLHGTVSTP